MEGCSGGQPQRVHRGGLVKGRSGQPQRVHRGGLVVGRSGGLLTGGGDTHSA